MTAPDVRELEILHVTHVVDGDTFDALVLDTDVGEIDGWQLSGEKVVRIRLVHLDTPEKGEAGYREAAADLSFWLGLRSDADLRVVTSGKDVFGRYLADVYSVPGGRARTASDWMVREANHGAGWPVWTRSA